MLNSLLLPLLVLKTPAKAAPSTCIFAHTYRTSCAPDGEHMYFETYAQVGERCCQQVCLGIARRMFGYGGTWTFDHNNGCEMGYVLVVSENGTSVRFEGPGGYTADLTPRGGSESASKTLVCVENSLGYHYESCLYAGQAGADCNFCPWCGLNRACLGLLGGTLTGDLGC